MDQIRVPILRRHGTSVVIQMCQTLHRVERIGHRGLENQILSHVAQDVPERRCSTIQIGYRGLMDQTLEPPARRPSQPMHSRGTKANVQQGAHPPPQGVRRLPEQQVEPGEVEEFRPRLLSQHHPRAIGTELSDVTRNPIGSGGGSDNGSWRNFRVSAEY